MHENPSRGRDRFAALPPVPNGWFQVAYSDQLPVGQTLSLYYFGQPIVLYRGSDGAARAIDAYCPHLGAHLGVGGKVEGDCLRCPFHGWRFDGAGICIEIPHASRIPPAARLRTWPLREHSGMIVLWHHADRGEPGWEWPAVAEIGAPGWTAPVRKRWVVRSHVQEMTENAVDAAHFPTVHGAVAPAQMQATADGPVMRAESQLAYYFGDMQTPIEGTTRVTNWGLGISEVRVSGVLDTLLVGTSTPIDDQSVELRFSVTMRRLGDESATTFVAERFVDELCRQVEEDIRVWEHKVFLERPVLCENDGPIATFRRWARQFYPATTAW